MKLFTIRDGKGQILGTTTQQSNGDSIARDRSGKVLGRSSEAFGNTRDGYGRRISNNVADPNLLYRR